jgi:hypothetical protein
MIRLDWDALRVGHHVLVHDEEAEGLPLALGRVTGIETDGGATAIAIRISPAMGPSRIVRPRRLAVHLDLQNLDERCWRCALGPAST